MAQQLYLVSLPASSTKPAALFAKLKENAGGSGNNELHRFDFPALNVGTLDSLMSLSDELVKLNTQVENVVRKVERQYVEISGAQGEALKVNDIPLDNYIKNFQWDIARYRFQGRPLGEIVAQIQSMAGKVDEDLKKLSQTLSEKQQSLGALQRRKTANFATADLEDVITPLEISRVELLNTDNLLTILVVVPTALEKDFLSSYSTIGADIANYGGPEWDSVFNIGKNDGKFGSAVASARASEKGSPVVPGSHKMIKSEGDSMLYSVVVLKGQHEAGTIGADGEVIAGKSIDYLEPLKLAFREKRFLVREANYDASKSGGLDAAIAKQKLEVTQAINTVTVWCKAHFGEIYSGWIHLKVIRCFAESVLRYGFPVNYLAMFVEPNMKKEKPCKTLLIRSVLNQLPELQAAQPITYIPKKVDPDAPVHFYEQNVFGEPLSVEDDEAAAEEEEDDSEEALAFVCQPFGVIGYQYWKH